MIFTLDIGYQPPAQNYGGAGVQGYGQPPAATGESFCKCIEILYV